jgi:hypothetical protein
MFKVVRHFEATNVLMETAQKTWEQLLGMLGLLTFLVVVFAIMLYEVETGHACFEGTVRLEHVCRPSFNTYHFVIHLLGDADCPEVVGVLPGQRFMVDKVRGASFRKFIPCVLMGSLCTWTCVRPEAYRKYLMYSMECGFVSSH